MENKGFNVNTNPESFDLMTTDETYKSHNFKKKKRGIAGFFVKIWAAISNWWKGLKKWQKITISTVSAVIALILVLVIVLLSVFGYNYNKITANPDDLGFENVIDKKIVNIALFGLDTRSMESFKGNSDSIMVLSVNTEAKTVKIVSVMRDSLVKIERDGKTIHNKINSAYAIGGPELAIKTINQNFGLDISEYATVNFYGMAEIIDAVGGIDVEFTRQEVTTNHTDGFNGLVKRQCKKLNIDPEPYYIRTEGKHHVNGIQAVAYSRIRKFVNVWGTNNDFGRTDRQRYVMEQLFNKALTLPKSKYVKLVKALIPYTETSLSYKEIMGLAFDVLLSSPTFEQTRMPLTEYQMKAPSIPRVGSCVYYDLEFAKNLLYAFFYEDIAPEAYVEENGITKHDWYRLGTSIGSSSEGSNKKPDKTTSSEKNEADEQDKSDKEDEKPSSKPGENIVSSKPQTSSKVESSNKTESSSKVETSSNVETSSESEASSGAESSNEAESSSQVQSGVSSEVEASSEAESSSKVEVSSEAESSSKVEASSEIETSSKDEVLSSGEQNVSSGNTPTTSEEGTSSENAGIQ